MAQNNMAAEEELIALEELIAEVEAEVEAIVMNKEDLVAEN
jgi:hypothetical protein